METWLAAFGVGVCVALLIVYRLIVVMLSRRCADNAMEQPHGDAPHFPASWRGTAGRRDR